jgi:hypothetical protein
MIVLFIKQQRGNYSHSGTWQAEMEQGRKIMQRQKRRNNTCMIRYETVFVVVNMPSS